VDAQELRQLLGLAAELTEPVESLAAARALLGARGIRHIELSPPYEDAGWFGQTNDADGGWGTDTIDPAEMGLLLRTYQALYDTVETAHGHAYTSLDVDVDAARDVSEQMVRSCDGTFTDIMQIVRYPDPDSYTIGHSVRVSMLALLIGHRLGLQTASLTELGAAALLHDIGKAKIPREILYKPGRLDEDDLRLVREHCANGAMMLAESRRASLLAIAGAWGHHLRHDGKGYPPPPSWAVRSNLTELLHLCDVFEALTAVRPYKPAHTPRRAYELMLSDPGEFDREMLTAFAGAIGVYPPGSRVTLSCGGLGVVVAAGRELTRPQVRLTHGPDQQPLAAHERRIIDLGDASAGDLSISDLQQDGTLVASAPSPSCR
jgi:HD-GYP domain-containing protein (c-di-GMP phosphodiesterase class II)